MAAKRRTIVRYARPMRRHSRPKMTIPLAVLGGLVPTVVASLETAKAQGPMGGLKMAGMRMTGYNPWVGKWYASEMAAGWVPLLAGVFAHKLANRIGINRAVARAGIPLVRI